ncbi:Uncharacterised protein [Vibrio cholerae]|nr:Uncharacterised protein [Vibrio cholerae]CSI57833.1 Uncharacterised protein [Vibrio cholerae]
MTACVFTIGNLDRRCIEIFKRVQNDFTKWANQARDTINYRLVRAQNHFIVLRKRLYVHRFHLKQ